MKVALLSFHNAYNYGAALQAYGLQCAVRGMGVECEYIDYQNEHRRNAYNMKYHFAAAVRAKNLFGAARSLLGMPFMSARAKGFDRFYADYLQKTASVYATSEEAKALSGAYDKFIVGSDQVWNPVNNGGDAAFLLDFVADDQKKISYSSSFGVSTLPPAVSDVYAKQLSRFYRLAVRESIGAELVETLTGRKAHLVLDPVFLAGKDEWDKIRANKTPTKQKYIFFYTNRQSQIRDFLNTGYTTDETYHVLSTHLTPKDALNRRIKTRVSMSPGEFLDEIANADLVVTASFHCLAFSILYHKPFVVLLTGDHGKDERVLNLLKMTGLESRILTAQTDPDAVAAAIDYDAVDKKLEPYLNASRDYLKRAIFDEPDIPFDTSMQNDLFCMDSRCTGCGACAAACPRGAISMQSDAEGFMTPCLDETKCVRCRQCHDVCQVYTKQKPAEHQRYYAVKNTDEIRKVSSSGGVFRALAERTFAENGVVCAAGMDRDFCVYHMFAESAEDLSPMCGTFYVQSDLKDAYPKVKAYLKENRPVLFMGTACQVAGLHRYLGAENERLLTCDILCHGAPSPMVFEAFIRYLKTKGDLSDFKFRDKSLGWKGYHVSAVINGKRVKNKLWLQSFNNLFSHNVINRLSCSSCPYAGYDRPGDLTIGDFWGLENSRKDFVDGLGVSLVITNTDKGERVFREMDFADVIEVEKNQTQQHSLLSPSAASAKRLQASQTLRSSGYAAMMKRYAEVSAKGRLKNGIRKIITHR